MASSDVEVINMALGYLGANLIMNKDDSQQAVIHYDTTRDACLEDGDWSFAMKRLILRSPTNTPPLFGYEKQFLLPTDFIRLIDVNLSKNDWVKEGRYILTNSETIQIQYISRVIDVRLMPASFVQALAARLASVMAIPLTNSVRTAQSYWTLYTALIAQANNIDSRQGHLQTIKRNVTLKRRSM